MLKKFTVEGYKNLASVSVELGRVTVLVGPNNSGKTNLLRAMHLPQELVSGARECMANHGGLAAATRTRDRVGRAWAEAKLHIQQENADGVLDLVLTANAPGWPREEWVLTRKTWSIDSLGWVLPRSVGEWTADPASPEGHYAMTLGAPPDDFELSILYDWQALHRSADFNNAEARAPRRSAAMHALDRNGVEISNVMKWLEQAENPTRWSTVKRLVREALPGVTDVRVRDLGEQFRMVELVREKHAEPIAELSDGTVQLLRLAILASDSAHVLLDEPDLHLHPAWQRMVGRWMLQSQAQFTIATHSPELLDALTPGLKDGAVRLIVFDDAGNVRQPTYDDLAPHFEEGWELGDLYRVGEPDLGGWPW